MIDENDPQRPLQGDAALDDTATPTQGPGSPGFDANNFWGSDWPNRTLMSMADAPSTPQDEAAQDEGGDTLLNDAPVEEPVMYGSPSEAEADAFVPQMDFPESGGQPEAADHAALHTPPGGAAGFGRRSVDDNPLPDAPAEHEAYLPAEETAAEEDAGPAYAQEEQAEPELPPAFQPYAAAASGFGRHASYEAPPSGADDSSRSALAEIAALTEPFERWAKSFRIFGALWLVLSLAFAGFLLLALLEYGFERVSWIETLFILGAALTLAITGFRAGLKAGGIARRLRQATVMAAPPSRREEATVVATPHEDSTGLMHD